MAKKSNRWSIVFEDDHILVIDKPSGWLTIPDRYNNNALNLLTSLQSYRDTVFVNHRLDRETSGLITFSKTEATHKAMNQLFESRSINKHYQAIVKGVPQEEVGMIDLPIAPSEAGKKGMKIHQKGKTSHTKYRILKSYDYFSHLELKLLTGRMHQIRVHLKAIHCPIVCDSLYGDGQAFYLSSIKRKYKGHPEAERPLLNRVALHSSMIGFEHPITNENLKFESPLPKDMKAVLYQLDKMMS